MRRALFQIHMWVGLVAGLYVATISVSGAALIFRIDMQRALYPELFAPATPGPLADPVVVMESVARAYPEHRLSGVEAPTSARPTYLAYVTSGREFRTVLIDPVSAQILGELPDQTPIRKLQDLHFDLMAGRTGRIVNGAGALAVLVMCATGLVIWWSSTRNWRRPAWQLHRAVGICGALWIAMWGLTGAYFVFPARFRSVLGRVSPITATRPPVSAEPPPGVAAPPTWRELIDRARVFAPDRHVARVVTPTGERGAFLVMFARDSPTAVGSDLFSIYLDRHTGERLASGAAERTASDLLLSWVVPLHVGAFASHPLKMIWFVMALSPLALFVTGARVWWVRVVRPYWRS